MSKTKALWFAVLCAALSALFLLWQQVVDLVPSVVLSLIFASIWFSKYRRDRRYVEMAKEASAASASPTRPEMTSPGSSKLFVPPPLDSKG